MTDYLDVNRDQGNNLFKLPEDTLMVNLLEAFPNLDNTAHASDTSMNKAIVKRSMSALINILNKKVSDLIERSSEDKNKFIKSFFKVNPVTFFHNEINSIADTDYYAYKNYRKQIQETIDKKIELVLMDTWNKVVVDKGKYLQYIKKFK